MLGSEFKNDSSEAAIVEKAGSFYSKSRAGEPKTGVLDNTFTANQEPEETGREEASHPSSDNDSRNEIYADKLKTQSDTPHKDDDVSFEEKKTVSNSSEIFDDSANLNPPRGSVLVVDDSLTVQKIVSIALKGQGYAVYTAGDGMQALSRLNEVIPDLIFVDVNMPHMDGYQLCKIIKNHGLTKKIPVVMMTGKTRILDKMKWKRAGASDYIAKPFDSGSLIETTARYIN